MNEFIIHFVGPFRKTFNVLRFLETLKQSQDILYYGGGQTESDYTSAGIEIRPEESVDKEALKAYLRDIFEQVLNELF